ncbi:MAG: HAD family hydrolase, partial [Catenulispora sp.]|nr:HAD family hydrolase [Catenulispora sp.]
AVVFDADDTLVDIRTAVRAGLEAVHGRTGIDVEELRADASAHWRRTPELPARQIRIAALRETLTRHGREADLEDAVEVFFDARYANSRPFPGALDVLAQLRATYTLGYATNANSRADLCGLGGQFSFEIYALTNGVPKKPDPAFFHEVVRLAGVPAHEVVYVGDNYEHDVAGGQRAGVRTVWLNKTGTRVAGETQIERLTDLPGALARADRLSLTGDAETL